MLLSRAGCLHTPCTRFSTPTSGGRVCSSSLSAPVGFNRLNSSRSHTSCVNKKIMSSTSRAHPKGHAVLHDFCVVFPASAFFLGIGSLGLLLGKSRTAAATAAVGAVQLILGRQSLQCWRAGTGSQVYTLAEATSSILVAYLTYQAWQQGMSKIFAAPTFMVSSLVALFLIYNVLAGGNPPPKKGV